MAEINPAVVDLYKYAQSKGYKGDVNSFDSFVKSGDEKAIGDLHKYSQSKGYKGDVESFKSLIGVEPLKKKQQSESGTIQPISIGEDLQQPQEIQQVPFSQPSQVPTQNIQSEVAKAKDMGQFGDTKNYGVQKQEPVPQKEKGWLKNIETTFKNMAGTIPAAMKVGASVLGTPVTTNPYSGTGTSPFAHEAVRQTERVLANKTENDKAFRQKAVKEYFEQQAEASKTNALTSYKDVEDFKDVINYATNSIIEAGVQIPASLVTGGMSSLLQTTGGIYAESVKDIADRDKITPEEVIQQGKDKPATALAFGGLSAALDFVGAGQTTGLFRNKIMKKIAEIGSKKLGTSIGGKIAKKVAIDVLPESGTEAAQSVIEQIGKNASTDKGLLELNTDEIVESAIKGLLGAGGIVTVANAPKLISAIKNNPKLTDEQKLQAEQTIQAELNGRAEFEKQANPNTEGEQQPTTSNAESNVPENPVTAPVEGQENIGQQRVEQPTEPESPTTLNRQVEMLVDEKSPKSVVMFTVGEQVPTKPEGTEEFTDKDGNVYFYNPQKISEVELTDKINSGKVQEALFYEGLKNKRDITDPITMSLKDKDGNEVLSIVTDRQDVNDTTDYLNSLAKEGDTVSEVNSEDVINARIEANKEQAQQVENEPIIEKTIEEIEQKVNSNADYNRINKELIKKLGDAMNKRNKSKRGTDEYVYYQSEVEKYDKILTDFKNKNSDLILEHGTPHDFDKFELEKIGTGEGNQAFGFGLYFTENSSIAKSYAEKLSKDKNGIIYQVRIKDGRNKQWLEWRDALDDSQSEGISKIIKDKKTEYDKYLSEVKDEKTHTGAAEQLFNENLVSDERPLQAGAVYLDLKDAFGQQEATEIMKEAGVDGVKYRTRGGKGDDFNYVVFNPKSIIIENKNKLNNETPNEQPTGEVPNPNMGEPEGGTTANDGGQKQTDTATGTGTTTSEGDNKQADKGVSHFAVTKRVLDRDLEPNENIPVIRSLIKKLGTKESLNTREQKIYNLNQAKFDEIVKSKESGKEGEINDTNTDEENVGIVRRSQAKAEEKTLELLENGQYESFVDNIINESKDENGKFKDGGVLKVSLVEEMILIDYVNNLQDYIDSIRGNKDKKAEYDNSVKKLESLFDLIARLGSRSGGSLNTRTQYYAPLKTSPEAIKMDLEKTSKNIDLTGEQKEKINTVSNELADGYKRSDKADANMEEINRIEAEAQEMAKMQKELDAVKKEAEQLLAENKRLKEEGVKKRESAKEKSLREKEEKVNKDIEDSLADIFDAIAGKSGAKLNLTADEQVKITEAIKKLATALATKLKIRGEKLVTAINDRIKEKGLYANNYKNVINEAEQSFIKSELPEIRAKMREIVMANKNISLDDFIAKTSQELDYLSEQDVRDILQGKGIAKSGKATVSEARQLMANLKKEADLIEEINNLRNGIVKEKDATRKQSKNERLEALKKQLKDLQKELGVKVEKTDEQRFQTQLKQRKGAIDKQIAEIENKIKKGEFEKVEKKPSILEDRNLQEKYKKEYKEYIDSKENLLEAKNKYLELQTEFQIANLKGLKLYGHYFNEARKTAFATLRGLFAMIDFSPIGVQLGKTTLRHPITMSKTLYSVIKKDIVSSENEKQFKNEIQNSEIGKLSLDSGMEYYGVNKDMGIEVIGGDYNLLTKLKVDINGKEFMPFKAIERINSMIINNTRYKMFKNEALKMTNEGLNFKDNPEEFKILARNILELTSHGKMQKDTKSASKFINLIVWSSKMWASNLNLIGAGDVYAAIRGEKGLWRSQTKRSAIFMAKELGATLSTLLLISAMIKFFKDDEDKEGLDFDLNPISGSFGELKYGEYSVAPLGAITTQIKNIAQIITGYSLYEDSLYSNELEEGTLHKGHLGGIYKIFRSKMTPEAGAFLDYHLHRKYNFYNYKYIGFTEMDKNDNTKRNVSTEGLLNLAKMTTIPMIVTNLMESKDGIDIAKSFVGLTGYTIKRKSSYDEVKYNKYAMNQNIEKEKKTTETPNKKSLSQHKKEQRLFRARYRKENK